MTDPVTTNKGYATPVNNADVGAWDVPVNGNSQILDKNLGGVLTLGLSNVGVTLSASQAQNAIIVLTGSLSASLTITLPAGQGGFYTLDDQTVNNGFVVQVQNPAALNAVAVPWGGIIDFYTDGSNCVWRNAPPPGSLLQFPTSSAPAWTTSGTPHPYLLCDGSTYNTVTYPKLFRVIGGTFGGSVPDLRGRAFYNIDGGAGRLGSVIAGTITTGGGSETVALTTGQLPIHTPGGSIGGSSSPTESYLSNTAGGGGVPGLGSGNTNTFRAPSIPGSGFTFTGNAIGSGQAHSNMPPALVGGITMIKT